MDRVAMEKLICLREIKIKENERETNESVRT